MRGRKRRHPAHKDLGMPYHCRMSPTVRELYIISELVVFLGVRHFPFRRQDDVLSKQSTNGSNSCFRFFTGQLYRPASLIPGREVGAYYRRMQSDIDRDIRNGKDVPNKVRLASELLVQFLYPDLASALFILWFSPGKPLLAYLEIDAFRCIFSLRNTRDVSGYS